MARTDQSRTTIHIVGTVLVGMVVALLASDPVCATNHREWVFTQRMMLDNHSSTECYDRRSLRKEGTVIRVRVQSQVARQILDDGCEALAVRADAMTFESEILIRCKDTRWAQTEDSRRIRYPEPPPEAKWRSARTGEYRNTIIQVCALASQLPDHGSVIYGNGTAKGNVATNPAMPRTDGSVSRRQDFPRTTSPGEPARSKEAAGSASSGTGFFVDEVGHILTNHHVVGSCSQVRVVVADKRRRAKVLAGDATLDLALVKVIDTTTTAYATFRAAAPPRAGEAVTVVGFPLRGLLASGPIVSAGIVNAVAGIRDDATRFQFSAPVQRGNSGGPILDASGNVIGVVVSKLDAVQLAQATGDMPQNINFAIKGDMARNFLEANKVSPRIGSWKRPIDSVAVAAIAKSMTVPVECE